MPSNPIACTLTNEDLAGQASRWRRLFADAGIDRRVVAERLRLRFQDAARVADELHRLVAIENECCSWADWGVEREAGTLVVVARSDGEGIAALHGMFVDLR